MDLECLAASGLAQGFDIEHGDAVLHAAEEVVEFGGFRGGQDGEARTQDFLARVAVHAFGGGVPFEDAQFGVIEDDGAGKGFQQSAIAGRASGAGRPRFFCRWRSTNQAAQKASSSDEATPRVM